MDPQAQADQYVRFPARQAGPFSDSANVVDLVLPASSDVYDMSSSYALLYVRPNLVSVRQNAAAIYQYMVFLANSSAAISPSALVRHCRLSTAKQSRVDERRFNNRLAATLYELTHSREQKLSESYKSMYEITNRAGILGGPFSQLVGDGDRPSLEREVPLYIPLSELTDLGRVEKWPMARSGETTLRLELEPMSNFGVAWSDSIPETTTLSTFEDQNDPTPNTAIITTVNNTYGSVEEGPFYVSQNVHIRYDEDGTATALTTSITAVELVAGQLRLTLAAGLAAVSAASSNTAITILPPVSFADQTDPALPTNQVITLNTYDRLEDSPFYNQMLLNFDYDTTTGGATALTTLVTAIEWVKGGVDNRKIRLTLADALTAVTGASTNTGINAYAAPPTDPAVSATTILLDVNRAELLMRKVRQPGPTPTSIQYLTYAAEDLTMSGMNPFQRVWYVPAATTLNVFLFFVDPDALHSFSASAQDYRVAIDGEYQTSFPIRFAGSEAIAQLRLAMANAGLPLKDLGRVVANVDKRTSAERYGGEDGTTITMVPQPIPIDASVPGRQISVQLEINYTAGQAGADRMLLYRQEIASLKF